MSEPTKWLLIKEKQSGQLDVIPTSEPFHDGGPECWCGAVQQEPGLWIHNEPN